jgi:arylsulfatase A-like enzyme
VFLSTGVDRLRATELLRRVRVRRVLLACALLGLTAAVAVLGEGTAAAKHSPAGTRAIWEATPQRPNIIFVLSDDLSSNLLQFMPHVQAMERDGISFQDYFVSDSLCCPSRASIFTGDFPHDTGVYSNSGKHGGFPQFLAHGDQNHTFALALQRAGYRTALMGKYLNGYMGTRGDAGEVPATYVPPGWSTWDGVGWGYPEFDYWLNHDGQMQYYGRQPTDYLTDVLTRSGLQFINSSVAQNQPFLLELSTFAPHRPYRPAPRFAHDFPGLQAPQPPNFDVLPTDAPNWLAAHPPLSAAQIQQINFVYRRRAQSVEAIDQMIGLIQATLAADGIARNTYLVFSSDNGLHAGEYRLMPGKMTAFDTDIKVPLVVDGPGVPAGASTDAMTENIDLAKTFTEIGATTLPSDGHSLMPLLHGQTPPDWRDAVLIEHRGPVTHQRDPDYQPYDSGTPPTYEAMRTHDFLYVEYADGEREYYDLRTDPFELHNLAAELSPVRLALLHSELLAIEQCHGGWQCWSAMHVGDAGGSTGSHA